MAAAAAAAWLVRGDDAAGRGWGRAAVEERLEEARVEEEERVEEKALHAAVAWAAVVAPLP